MVLWSTNHSQTPQEKVCVSEGQNSFLCNFVVKHPEIFFQKRLSIFSLLESLATQAQYESLIINTCGFILRNPLNGHEHKGFVWEFR